MANRVAKSTNWLVGGLGFTAPQHFVGYIAPVSVVNVRMSARAGLVLKPAKFEEGKQ